MKFESALQLKTELLGEAKIVPEASARAKSRTSITSDSRSSIVSPAKAPLALGITGKNGKYRLAIRIHSHCAGMDVVLNNIHAQAKGETDVKIIGRVTKQQKLWHQTANRPLQIGGSIGHLQTTAGTLGCFVTKDGKQDLILSNNHVLANENKGNKGDAILQPGKFDQGKSPRDKVGELGNYVRLKKSENLVDCATSSIVEEIEYFYNYLEQIGPIQGVRNEPLDEGEAVFKIGRTTGLTQGKVSAIEIDQLVVEFDMGEITFNRQFEIEPVGSEPFSLGGDSGSLIVDSHHHAVGLLFAGNDINATYANDINNVLKALKVELVF